MELGHINFPNILIKAIREKKLVIFAGAGVSMGEPAMLPSFSELSDLVSAGTGKSKREKELDDKFMGRLHDSGIEVHQIAAKHLSRPAGVFNAIQNDLLRVFMELNQVKLVTTNFDALFESAAKSLWGQIPEVFRAPALPLGKKFSGIIHIHGALTHCSEMVLTDRDFGRAYLTEGWARKFLLDLFSNHFVLFVGYSHNDTDLQYLARSLPPQQKNRFALIPEGDNYNWEPLGITPISYPQHTKGDHSSLSKSIKELADFARMDVLDWRKFIKEIAIQKPSDLNIEPTGKLLHALQENIANVRFFVENAKDIEWLEWLKSHKFLDALFDNSQINLEEKSLYFVDWIIKKVVSQKPEKALLFLGEFRNSINPTFWLWLSRYVSKSETTLERSVFEKWVIFLLDRSPQIFDEGHSICELGEKAESEGCFDLLPIIFEKIIATKLVIKEPWVRSNPEEVDEKSDIDQNFGAVHWNIKKFWDECLSIHLDQLAMDVLLVCIGFFDRRNELFVIWRGRKEGWDRDGLGRYAIEPDGQDLHPESIDVVIDAMRDSLTKLLETETGTGKFWCDQLIKRNSPMLRRLAIHSARIDSTRTPADKMDWILQTDINDFETWHETFIFIRDIYPSATENQRNLLIKKIEDHKVVNVDWDENKRKEYFDRHCFDWFSPLNVVDSSFAPMSEKLSKLMKTYPTWIQRERPDLLHSHGETVRGEVRSPWTVEQLLAAKASKWLGELLEYKPKNFFDGDRSILLNNVTDASKRDLKWAGELANELERGNHWSSDLWDALFKAWQFWPDESEEAIKILKWLGSERLFLGHGKSISETLKSLVKDGGKKYTIDILNQTNVIGLQIWPKLARVEITGETKKDWLISSLIDPAGILTQYFLGALTLEMGDRLGKIPESYRKTLELMISDSSSSGAFARTYICSQFGFLLDADEAWTMEKVYPLFTSDYSDDFSLAWSGFVTWARLSPKVGATLSEAFLKAISRLSTELNPIRERFVENYTYMMLIYVENPLDKWIPSFFNVADAQDKLNFAQDIGEFFGSEIIGEEQKEMAWKRWVLNYWKNRMVGNPAPFEGQEIGIMLGWLPQLRFALPEVALLLESMKPMEFERTRLCFDLRESPLVDSFPNEVAKILIFFLSSKCKYFHPSEIEPIITRLKGKISDLTLKESLNNKLLEKGCKAVDE